MWFCGLSFLAGQASRFGSWVAGKAFIHGFAKTAAAYSVIPAFNAVKNHPYIAGSTAAVAGVSALGYGCYKKGLFPFAPAKGLKEETAAQPTETPEQVKARELAAALAAANGSAVVEWHPEYFYSQRGSDLLVRSAFNNLNKIEQVEALREALNYSKNQPGYKGATDLIQQRLTAALAA